MQKILIVDDDKLTCDFIQEILEEFKVETTSAQDPQAAIELGKEEKFDVIISDINLQNRLTGLDILKNFKHFLPDSEVILISGFGTLETAIEAVREGAFDYISKPFNVQEVIATARRALAIATEQERAETDALKELSSRYASSGLVGHSRQMIGLYME